MPREGFRSFADALDLRPSPEVGLALPRWPARVAAAAFCFALLVTFAVHGPRGPFAIAAACVALLAAVALLPRPPFHVVLPLSGLLLLLPKLGPGVHHFDFAAAGMALLVLVAMLRERDRSAFQIRGPGLFAAACVALPLLAVPYQVRSLSSFLGAYIQIMVFAALFLSLRRLVPPERSRSLLWVFPIVGAAAACQLFAHTGEITAGLSTRLAFRTLFTQLPWGASNFVASLIVLCLLGSLLLAVLDRRIPVRILLAAAGVLMLQALSALSSRGATVALGAAVLVLLVGWGGIGRWIVGASIAGAAALLLATPAGQVLAARFIEPREFASWYARIEAWELSWQRFLEQPLTGIGLNQGRYQQDLMGGGSAHNLLLDYLIEQGILGGVFVLALFVAVFRLCGRVVPVGSAAPVRRVRLVLIALVVGALVNASVEPTLSAYVVGCVFVWFLAWLTLQDSVSGARVSPSAG